ncbi:MAG: hypothetical protein HAW66_06385 [Shewanella sp.]|nr:hypothetical protein [Shewanella sp.]
MIKPVSTINVISPTSPLFCGGATASDMPELVLHDKKKSYHVDISEQNKIEIHKWHKAGGCCSSVNSLSIMFGLSEEVIKGIISDKDRDEDEDEGLLVADAKPLLQPVLLPTLSFASFAPFVGFVPPKNVSTIPSSVARKAGDIYMGRSSIGCVYAPQVRPSALDMACETFNVVNPFRSYRAFKAFPHKVKKDICRLLGKTPDVNISRAFNIAISTVRRLRRLDGVSVFRSLPVDDPNNNDWSDAEVKRLLKRSRIALDMKIDRLPVKP